jgi:LacI family transcriptional regulator, repressor for deo operon, udp, cdd, tsx, nupC, and nupG
VIVALPSMGDPFFHEVMTGIQAVAREMHYSVLIRETRFDAMAADEFGKMLVSREADGLILLASVPPFGNGMLALGKQRKLPVVIGCEPVARELEHLPSVHIDNLAASREATGYLISLGHTRIGFIDGVHDSPLTRDRLSGFRAAMSEARLLIAEGWVVEGNMTIEGAIGATGKLLEHVVPPTAIFCANDEMAIATMHACVTAGLEIPRDISVIGIDNIRFAAIATPPLTTIAQPAEEIGRRTMYRLCRAMEKKAPLGAEAEIVPHTLIERGSCAPPAK